MIIVQMPIPECLPYSLYGAVVLHGAVSHPVVVVALRWQGYLGLLLFDVLICLLVLFGLIRNSKALLIG